MRFTRLDGDSNAIVGIAPDGVTAYVDLKICLKFMQSPSDDPFLSIQINASQPPCTDTEAFENSVEFSAENLWNPREYVEPIEANDGPSGWANVDEFAPLRSLPCGDGLEWCAL